MRLTGYIRGIHRAKRRRWGPLEPGPSILRLKVHQSKITASGQTSLIPGARPVLIARLTVAGLCGIILFGVAYAAPPPTVPGTVHCGGKGTAVSGRCRGPIVSDVIAGGSAFGAWKAR